MTKKYVIAYSNLPARLPVTNTLIVWLLLNATHPEGWIVGATWTAMTLLWVVALIVVFTQNSKSVPGFGGE